MSVEVIQGDCRDVLRTLPDASVSCCVTSPPYYGQRDYGHAAQIGLEQTWTEYVDELAAVFRELRRVLHPSGTVFLNLGDTYATGAGAVGECPGGGEQGEQWAGPMTQLNRMRQPGFKRKDLMLLPHRAAIALQDDGWWVRSDIVWAKGNPMPESVGDRPTQSHEYIFLLAKSEWYFYDAEAIAEPAVSGREYPTWAARKAAGAPSRRGDPRISGDRGQWSGVGGNGVTRNRRDVWHVNAQPFPESHYAVFPEALVEPCILAGTSAYGCCAACGNPWERVKERTDIVDPRANGSRFDTGKTAVVRPGTQKGERYLKVTTGWQPTCRCNAGIRPAVVLDPFAGSGTTGVVATRRHRDCILIELNPEYVDIIHKRLASVQQTLPMHEPEEAV